MDNVAYVYVIEEIPLEGEKTGSWCKIGYSKNPPEWRLNANLKRGNPRDLVIRHCFQFESAIEARDAEEKAHTNFKSYLRTKEWFNIESSSIEEWFLKSLNAIPRQ